MYQMDTIVAISTALGEGAIGIVRLSGPEAIKYAAKVFKGKDLVEVPSHTIHYGHIVDPKYDTIIDEVMVSVMRAPRSFTTEDVVEVNCHGGVVAVQRILDLFLQVGARLAEPGEFTKRAFLNGRIDLSQAEAVMDLIQAKTSRAMTASMNQLRGSLSGKIRQLRHEMLQTLAQVEVTIDYPEYDDVEEVSLQYLRETSYSVKKQIEQILQQAQQGKLFREGIQTAIIGRPNVGKSSLLNRLTGIEKAIVTDIEGTTRDTIEEYVNIRGVPLKLIDTAGIRQTDEIVERIGVDKSRQMIEQADLIILLLNQSERLQETDIELLTTTKDKTRIILLNKQDLPAQLDQNVLAQYTEQDEVIYTSMATENGIEQLETVIEQKFFAGHLQSTDVNYLLNSRHTALLYQAIEALDEVLGAIEAYMPVDLIQIDFTKAWDLLGEIIGESVQDELLDKLFSQFCLGK
ncbi:MULTISPECIES: tRNA uridine-5-carboxymethylaminomethyl(34) synthesis GTPase MnmE [unclassified Facklamia]|uniref:tRNA uridine-5-carboxymethylaminomethyl(34) synthesis GTPase MnmE n=1 Tax=Aerococcaceae TaxID=186827 RepID=UPI0013BE4C2A|nr:MULTISPECIES: tRNA uridine-5-carboxymethylaminomethyl(34) synthesis GTPase MnmE [unclassified Facklamia]MBS4462658.1 tRNA uridine-5-carboxymethylaminomethyl(34) synthesis GTPase MnmE [Aerococcaceae bacterium zg-B36]NEW64942.1 tRNA uridine-5-carboxymethylaminomethyl(34) synthesis GTPase MnmE [Facklamia sp. 252]NEW68403.1 tRNA uridine-5-carboxymethylaminomethyl(34) synthesis GTPase MnmE [Facklamia sp. 253]QQD65542.1 tRNA uridine-5-carboxymethylaminomethyl(34) synthesis GTPase MnmE [Aerococcace